MSEDYVIRHAAPTLAGIKTGNLFPCTFSSPQALVGDLRAMNQVLVPRGAAAGPLHRVGERVLLYLSGRRPSPGTWPRRRPGHPPPGGVRHPPPGGLPGGAPPPPPGRGRVPPRDRPVPGLSPGRRGGVCPPPGPNRYTYRGCWKVYGDEAAARRRFAAFRACTANYCRRRARGASWRGWRWPPARVDRGGRPYQPNNPRRNFLRRGLFVPAR